MPDLQSEGDGRAPDTIVSLNMWGTPSPILSWTGAVPQKQLPGRTCSHLTSSDTTKHRRQGAPPGPGHRPLWPPPTSKGAIAQQGPEWQLEKCPDRMYPFPAQGYSRGLQGTRPHEKRETENPKSSMEKKHLEMQLT